jgi:Tol biopolymer transport system component/DNA-binding winged helix-turn-helix (wHTH) protein
MAEPQPPLTSSFMLAGIHVDPMALTLTAPDQTSLAIQQKPMEVLQFLVQQYPKLVSREQLIDAVWAGNVYVGEKALTNAIWQLRHHLQQLAAVEIISTVRKKGYRLHQAPEFIQPVNDADLSAAVPLAEQGQAGIISAQRQGEAGTSAADTWQTGSRQLQSTTNRNRWWILLVVALLLVIAGGWWWLSKASPAIEQKLTQGSGRALFPSLSDDGRYLAFSWRKFEQASDLYLMDLQSPDQQFKQLTFSNDNESRPVWGRDNRHLYYSTLTAVYGRCQIMQLDLRTLTSKKLAECSRHSTVYLDVSPDGRFLLFNGSVTEDGRSLYQLDLQNSEAKPVALPCKRNCQHRVRDIAFSPDGKYLAMTRRGNALSEQIYLHELATGEETQLTQNEEDIVGMEWHPDGRRLVYGALRQGKRRALLLDIENGNREDLGVADFAVHSRITPDGVLYFHRLNSASQLAYLPLQAGMAGALFPLTASDERYESPDYSAARNSIVYVSNGSGYMEIWMADPDMSVQKQLTQLHGIVKYPRWSNDGQKVVFVARFAGEENDRLTVLDTNTGQLTTLPTGANWHRRPSWTPDDQAVIYTSGSNLYQFELASGQIRQLTQQGGVFSRIAPDGSFFFTKGSNQGLWLLQPDGSEQQVLSGEQFSPKYAWTLVGSDVYFLHQIPNQLVLSRYERQTGKVQQLQLLPAEQLFPYNTISYDPQQQRLLLELAAFPRADIVKLEHPLLK